MSSSKAFAETAMIGMFASAGFSCDDGVTGAAQRAYNLFGLFVDILHGAHVDNVLEIGEGPHRQQEHQADEGHREVGGVDLAVELVDFLNVLKDGVGPHEFPIHKNRIGVYDVFIGRHQMDFFIQNGTMIF